MPPPSKRRRLSHPTFKPSKATTKAEEISFDPAARKEYLTGFHKRKLARAKHAREIAVLKDREERIRERKKLRDQRKGELQERLEVMANAIKGGLTFGGVTRGEEGESERGVDGEDEEDDNGSASEGNDTEEGDQELKLDHEDEYIDEDKFTTVVVEEVDVDRDGLHKVRPQSNVDLDNKDEENISTLTQAKSAEGKRQWTKEKPRDAKSNTKKREKKKKFRYESKAERKVTREKERSKNRKQASARRTGE